MSDYISKVSQSTVVIGTGTWTHITKNTGAYRITVTSTEVPTSGLSISITNNGTQIASASVSSATQQELNLDVIANVAAAGNPLAVVLSSSTPIDLQLNTVKSVINIRVGGQ